jgi:dihydropteroate synthase
VREDGILVDPGFGFGKSTRLDLILLRDLERVTGLGFPVLVACSHKEFTADATGAAEHDLTPTIAAAVLASRAGAAMLRLHEVAECRPAIALADAVRSVGGT